MTKRLLLPLAVYAGILGLSSIPGDDAPSLWPGFGYVAHAVEYAGLGAALHWALAPTRHAKVTRIVAICLLLAIADEAYQSTVPGRTPEVVDVVIDVTAALAAAALSSRVRQTG